jgi:PadR family transcriptional regulator PadR
MRRKRMGQGFGIGRNMGSGRWLEGYVLLLLSKNPSHGYDLTHSMMEFDVEFSGIGQMGTLYRILRQMEEEGLVISNWHTRGKGAARRVYKLTPLGEEHLKNYVEQLKDLKKRINDFIDFYEKGTSH